MLMQTEEQEQTEDAAFASHRVFHKTLFCGLLCGAALIQRFYPQGIRPFKPFNPQGIGPLPAPCVQKYKSRNRKGGRNINKPNKIKASGYALITSVSGIDTIYNRIKETEILWNTHNERSREAIITYHIHKQKTR